MSIQNIIIIILSIVIVVISTAFGVTVGLKNKDISEKAERIELLTAQLGQAEASLELQNSLVEQYKLDIAQAKEQYSTELANLNKTYNDKLASLKDNMTCDEALQVISRNQQEFLYAK